MILIKAANLVKCDTIPARDIRKVDAMRLFMLLYTLAGTAMAGTGVIVVLTLGMAGAMPILVAAALGAGLALPVAWLLTRELR